MIEKEKHPGGAKSAGLPFVKDCLDIWNYTINAKGYLGTLYLIVTCVRSFSKSPGDNESTALLQESP